MNGCELIGITGGIGAGKSVLSRILRLKGYSVYDCDSRAKMLMDESLELLDALLNHFGEECVTPARTINRSALSKRVFENDIEREWLNALVHSEVRRDLAEWCGRHGKERILFVESAIIYSSGLADMCDRILLVEASEETRIERAVSRGGISRENLMLRMEAQRREFDSLPEEKLVRIVNDDDTSLLSQIDRVMENWGKCHASLTKYMSKKQY